MRDTTPGDEWLSIQIRASDCLPWYKRFWVAIKYAFGSEMGYDEVILSVSDRERLAKILKPAKKSREKDAQTA
jgi:hypothetical protein